MKSNIEKWFLSLKEIWLSKDITKVKNLLSEKFEYYEDPFDPPITDLIEIENIWKIIENEDIISLDIDLIMEKDNMGIASYNFIYKDTENITHNSKGIYFVKIDVTGRATEFRRWWASKVLK